MTAFTFPSRLFPSIPLLLRTSPLIFLSTLQPTPAFFYPAPLTHPLASFPPGLFRFFTYFAAGLIVGFSGLAAGIAVNIVGDFGVRATSQQLKIFIGLVMILIVG